MRSPEGDISMSPEAEQTAVALLGAPARGDINPQTRVDNGDIDAETIDRVAHEIDQHYVWLGGELVEVSKLIPCWCVDGRLDQEGAAFAPNAAGGTYSLVVGDALIDAQALISNGETSASHAKTLFQGLQAHGYEIGGHQDNQANTGKCGCGACDKMGIIFQFIAENIHELSEKAASLGVAIDKTLQQKIKTNTEALLEANYVSSGPEMIKTVKDVAGEDHVQTLLNDHNEVILVVNTKEGTTLDRRSLSKEFGDDYEAFNLDVWALDNGIKAIATSETEANEKLAASVLYNIATACVLAGPSLRLVVR